jgi:hypothetical protein
MMVLSYSWGQKQYRIPYAWKKLVAYIVIVVLVNFIHEGITYVFPGDLSSIIWGVVLLALYMLFILKIEKKEFQKLPVIGQYI